MQIDHQTTIFGIIGYPLRHSLSSLMHNQAFGHLGINALYIPFEIRVERLDTVIESAKTLNIRGFNVTIPHKERILPFLDELSEEVRACGSVNTVVIEDGVARGFNTDGAGFMRSLPAEKTKNQGLAVILGAGGAARAIGFELGRNGWETVVVNRNIHRAEVLADDIVRHTGSSSQAATWQSHQLPMLLSEASMVINATPVGMYPEVDAVLPLDFDWLPKDAIICDIVYNPLNTRFLKEARRRGLKTVDGLGMFVHQGALSFKMFTGQEAPLQVMRNVVSQHLVRQ